MAISKAQEFSESQIRTAELVKALSHPARIAILELLIERSECICGDITDELPLAQSTVSQHLKSLKKAGLVKGKVDGLCVCYCLNEETAQELDTLMTSFTKNLKGTGEHDCC